MCTILQYITHQSQMITDEKFVNKLQFTTSISICYKMYSMNVEMWHDKKCKSIGFYK